MGGINKSIFDFIELGVVASGGDPKGKGDHPKDESSNQKVLLPATHDPKNVKQEHLAFSPLMNAPTALNQQTFHGVMDPGSLVYFLKFPGQTGGVILGQANDLVNYDKNQAGGGAGGGKDLLGEQFFKELFDRETGVNVPPDIEDAEVNGAKVKKVKEKNKKHKHSLLKGLPSHGASFPMSGYRLPEVKNVPTAIQEFSNIPTNDMLSNLPGNPMSLGSMFSGLGFGGGGGGGSGAGTGAGVPASGSSVSFNYADGILANVRPEIADAMTNMAILTQNYETSGDLGSYPCGYRVDTETYFQNAAELLNQVDNLSDLMEVCNRLQYDEELFGLENLSNNVIQVETAWGNANVIITGTGDTFTEYSNTTPQTDFSNNLSSPSSNPGSGSGQNMFGGQSSSLMDMMQRLAPNAQKQMKNVMGNMNSDMDLQQIVKQTIEGGNPLSMFMS
jgi:hypothetical protein